MTIFGQNQRTIQNKISCFGRGVHSGDPVHLSLVPAEENTGISFIRTDLKENNVIPANYLNVSDTKLCTTISNEFGTQISTVEHLMAALWGCGIDNVIIEVNNQEIPIMDGSSEPFVFLIECAGIKEQQAKRKFIAVKEEVEIHEGDAYIKISPAENFEADIKINFPNSTVIGTQHHNVSSETLCFKTEVSRARTFGFAHEVAYLQKIGLAKGGSLENAIVVDGDTILNQDGLRFNNEFARHKLLDCIGDMYLAGCYIKGKVSGYCSGHKLNNMLLRRLFESNGAYEVNAGH